MSEGEESLDEAPFSLSLRRLSTGLWQTSPFRLFAVAGLVGALAVLAASIYASGQAGEREAISYVERQTEEVAVSVIQPNLSQAVLDGEPAALERFASSVEPQVLTSNTVRVKLWTADGVVLFSDEERIIGERFELEEDKTRALETGETVAEVSSLEDTENQFEAGEGDLLEVYYPVDAPDGSRLLYEAYYALSEVSDSAARIRSVFTWGLSRRTRANQEERERLLRRVIESSDLERRRIAGDLHDGVVQDLVGTSLSVTAAAEQVGRFSPEVAADLNAAAVSTRHSLQSLRSLLVEIYPPNLHEKGLEAALLDLLAPAASLGVEAALSVSGEVDADADDAALTYRVIQEAVRNVFRHAQAGSLEVAVEATSSSMTSTVRDDGVGFTTGSVDANRLGLRLLTDLAAGSGARFDIDSRPGEGTSIRMVIPR